MPGAMKPPTWRSSQLPPHQLTTTFWVSCPVVGTGLALLTGEALSPLELAGGVLRLTLDRPGGVDIGVIGTVTRAVSRLLDEDDPIAGEYTLEVTSPGLERPLRTPAHFIGAVGTVVTVKTRAGVEGDRRLKGPLVAADDTGFDVQPESGPVRRLAYDEVERVRTVFEWEAAPKPGKPKPGKPKKAAASKAAPKKPSTDKKAAKP